MLPAIRFLIPQIFKMVNPWKKETKKETKNQGNCESHKKNGKSGSQPLTMSCGHHYQNQQTLASCLDQSEGGERNENYPETYLSF